MGSTFTSLHYHLVFSTKERRPFLNPKIREGLFPYMTGALQGMSIALHAIGGVEDHVQLLFGLRPSHCLSDVVKGLKSSSGSWLRDGRMPGFYWQDGYAAFTVGSSGVAAVTKYIAGQEEHHHKVSYLDELRLLLDEAGIPYEDRFLL